MSDSNKTPTPVDISQFISELTSSLAGHGAKPSDLWQDLLAMQIYTLKEKLPAELRGVIEFRISDGSSIKNFFLVLDGMKSVVVADSGVSDCIVESTETAVSASMYRPTEMPADLKISGDALLFKNYWEFAAAQIASGIR